MAKLISRAYVSCVDAAMASTSPAELADLPVDFWSDAELTMPVAKQAISLRVDKDVLAWFREQGTGWQTRINMVLKAFKEASAQPPPPPARQAPSRKRASL